MKKEIIESEHSYKCLGGAICGGVISKSLFDSEPMAYLMSYVMDDDKFEIYKKLNSSKGTSDQKEAKRWFKKYAVSMI